ncbi:MAG: DUF4258 domain-containing protein [Endomicrobia bacterium]|nr:DUF4258 domain-containing protein [Endomicrobiia bacterium]MDW8056404.1 DUF4258 domain-containing protein [Elusimicrobiota bacterium]
MKKIKIDIHTLQRAAERGTTQEEIIDVILNGIDTPAKYNRRAKYKIYEFNQVRCGKFYKHKKVEVYFIEESDIIITITVYVFYGEWR